VNRKGCEGGSIHVASEETPSMLQANIRTSVSTTAGKRKVIPSSKVIASKFQSVAQSSRSQAGGVKDAASTAT